MQVNVSGLRRNIKNITHNYSGAQKKVREATSNDPWGPSSTIMSEIADLTYNVVAFSEIMHMIWKRLNDNGRKWRHVYKALVLLEYLIRTGSEKVAQQCKENIFVIKTLTDFQYIDEEKDQGLNVREKAKQLVSLLKDEEKLKNERARALKAKERLAQTACGIGSDGQICDNLSPSSPRFPPFRNSGWTAEAVMNTNTSNSPSSGGSSGNLGGELEHARPQTAGEEELQLQLALAMSREEAEQDAAKRRSDQMRLQLAISQSQNDFQIKQSPEKPKSHINDLLDASLTDFNIQTTNPATADPWSIVTPPPVPPPPVGHIRNQADPWGTSSPPTIIENTSPIPTLNDPWSPKQTNTQPLNNWNNENALNNNILDGFNTSPKLLAANNTVPPVPPPRDPWAPLGDTISPAMQGVNAGIVNSTSNITTSSSSDLDDFDIITNRNLNGNSKPTTNGKDPFNLDSLGENLLIGSTNSLTTSPNHQNNINPAGGAIKKTPLSFLGENSALVNLDNLVTPPTNKTNTSASLTHGRSNDNLNNGSATTFNPFAETLSAQRPPTINQMMKQNQQISMFGNVAAPIPQNDPWAPVNTQQSSAWTTAAATSGQQPNPFFS